MPVFDGQLTAGYVNQREMVCVEEAGHNFQGGSRRRSSLQNKSLFKTNPSCNL